MANNSIGCGCIIPFILICLVIALISSPTIMGNIVGVILIIVLGLFILIYGIIKFIMWVLDW